MQALSRLVFISALTMILSAQASAATEQLQDIRVLSSEQMQGRATGTPGAKRAREYIAERFGEIGLEPVVREDFFHPFEYRRGRAQGMNVIAELAGCDDPQQVVVVTAHYDHLGMESGRLHPGADDNASGVAAMLALATKLNARERRCPAGPNWLFVATDAEEDGLYGSQAFVDTPPIKHKRIILNLNLDMIARGERRNRLFLTGTREFPALRTELDRLDLDLHIKYLGHRGPNSGRRSALRDDWPRSSDHGPFHQAGIPYLFFGGMDHPDYHQPSDTWQRIDEGFLTEVMQAIVATARWIEDNHHNQTGENPATP